MWRLIRAMHAMIWNSLSVSTHSRRPAFCYTMCLLIWWQIQTRSVMSVAAVEWCSCMIASVSNISHNICVFKYIKCCLLINLITKGLCNKTSCKWCQRSANYVRVSHFKQNAVSFWGHLWGSFAPRSPALGPRPLVVSPGKSCVRSCGPARYYYKSHKTVLALVLSCS